MKTKHHKGIIIRRVRIKHPLNFVPPEKSNIRGICCWWWWWRGVVVVVVIVVLVVVIDDGVFVLITPLIHPLSLNPEAGYVTGNVDNI